MDSDANPFGFTGHEHDDETGLIYAKARFYDPVIGRFLSEDPAEPNQMQPPSLHRYLYAYQNPTTLVDPDGRWPTLKEVGAFVKAGAKAALIAGAVTVAATAVVVAAPTVAAIAVGATVYAAGKAGIERYEQAIEDDPDASLSDSLKLGASDALGLTAIAEGLDGTEVGTGRKLSGEERAERLGDAAGSFAGGAAGARLGLRGGRAIRKFGDDIGDAAADGIRAGAREAAEDLAHFDRPRPRRSSRESPDGPGSVRERTNTSSSEPAARRNRGPREGSPDTARINDRDASPEQLELFKRDSVGRWMGPRPSDGRLVHIGAAGRKTGSTVGRGRDQTRLRQILGDPKLGRHLRGWIKQEIDRISRGTSSTVRRPPGHQLAHRRGREAAKGFDHVDSPSMLQEFDLHQLQHAFDDFGRLNKLRPDPYPDS